MKNLGTIFVFLIFLFSSCNENRIYEGHTDPSGNLEWNKDEVVEFDVTIKDTTIDYKVIAALRYAQGFAFSELPVTIVKTSPSGKKESVNHVFHPRSEDGSYVGEAAGDIWDLEEVLIDKVKFPEQGEYHYTFQHTHEREKIHMVMEVGLIVDKVINPPR